MYVSLGFILIFRLCPWRQVLYITLLQELLSIQVTWVLTPSDLSFHPIYMQEHNCYCNIQAMVL